MIKYLLNKYTIKTKLVFIISAIIIISLSVMIFLATIFFKKDNEIRIRENNHNMAQMIANQVQSGLNVFLSKAQMISYIQEYYSPVYDISLSSRFFKNNRDIIFFGIGEKKGEKVHFTRSLFNINFLDTNELAEKDIEKLFKISDKSFLLTFNGATIFHNVSYGLNLPVLGISFPFKTSPDGIKSIAVLYINPEHMLEAFKTFGITKAFMVNDHGEIIAHSDRKYILSRANMRNIPLVNKMLVSKLNNGQMRYRGEDGNYYIGSFKKLNNLRLGIIVTAMEDEIFKEVYNIQRRNIFILIIVLNVSVLIVFLFARTLSNPIIDLVNTTHQFQEKNLSAEDIKGKDEVVFLTHSFNSMISSIQGSQKKLKDYADNLEGMVEERTQELKESKKETDDIMDTVQQGIITINYNGTINAEYSARVINIFERNDLSGKMFVSLFDYNSELKEKVSQFIKRLFINHYMTESMFKKFNPLANCHYSYRSNNIMITKILEFSFNRIYGINRTERENHDRDVQKVMVVINDKTEEFKLTKKLELKAKKQTSRVEKLYQIITLESDVFNNFIKESILTLDDVVSWLNNIERGPENNIGTVQTIFRAVHSLKGNARALNLQVISELAHNLETEISYINNNLNEITEEQIQSIHNSIKFIKDDIMDGNDLFKKILGIRDSLNIASGNSVTEFENIIKNIIENESGKLNKSVKLIFENEITVSEFKLLIKEIRNSLIQIVLNSIAHGIEEKEIRKQKGKPESGIIYLKFYKHNDNIIIVCKDDGAGLNIGRLKEQALNINLISLEQSESMDSTEVLELIFVPGFSTVSDITETSGRGVGLDIVRDQLKSRNATIKVNNMPDIFLEFIIEISLNI